MKPRVVTGLDIGTSLIKILIIQKIGEDLDVLAQARVPSFGLRKGVVFNPEEVSKNIQTAFLEIQKNYNKKVDSVFVNIGGNHLYVIPSDGTISVSRADQKVSQEDIDRVLQSTQAINLPSNEEVLDVFPAEFIIDDQKGIKEPLGLTGIRLRARVLLLCAFSSYLKNLSQAVLENQLKIEEIIPSPLAAARAVLTPQQKELGVALVDIGAATTELAVFEEGSLIHLVIFPIGSANITNDIAIGLRTDINTAERIKIQFGSCLLGRTEKERRHQGRKKIEIFDKSAPLIFSQKMLVDIIGARVSEIFDLIQKELKKISRQELLPAGVVLSGGGAKLPKIVELAKRELKLPCKIGVSKGVVGLEEDPSLATVAGLVLEGFDFLGEENFFDFAKWFWSKIKKMFRSFKP